VLSIKKTYLLFYFLFIPAVFAQSVKIISIETRDRLLPFGLVEKVPEIEPSVGLALSGGGARGLAQVGVLKALDEAGISIEAISGTSVGSIIGGLYAAGYNVNELDSIIKATNWDDILSVSSVAGRRELFIDQKISEDRSAFTLRLDGFNPVIPTSFNEGLRLTNYLTLLTLKAPVVTEKSFDRLLYRFRAVCTDLVDGKMIVLDQGSLSRAMRASSSVTFFLAPVQMDTLTLVDGGLVANVPVDVAKDIPTDFVIAVNTTSPLHEREELGLPWYIADQTVSIPMRLLVDEQLSKADFVIEPGLKEYTSTDFDNADTLMQIGYTYAASRMDLLKAEIDSIYQRRLKKDEFTIKKTKYRKAGEEFENTLLEKYHSQDSVLSSEVLNDMYVLYQTGKFKSIYAEIKEEKDSTNIIFHYELNPDINYVETEIKGLPPDQHEEINLNELIGKPFKPGSIIQAIIRVIKEYKNDGYLLFNLEDFSFDEKSGKLILIFDAGKVAELNISSESSKEIIEREFPISVGDNFNYEEVKEGLDNLRSTGLFDDISLTVNKTDKGIILNLKAADKISSLLRLGFLVDNVYNLQLGIDLRDVNFLGTGTEMGMFVYGGASNRAYILEHIAHRVLDSYLTYKFNVFYRFNDIKVYMREQLPQSNNFTSTRIGTYRQIYYGGTLSLGTQLEKFGRLIFTGKYQMDEIKNREGNTVNAYKTKIVGLRISATIDNQNRYPYPDEGMYFNGYYETAQSFLGGDEGYIMTAFNFKYYFKFHEHVISPRIQLGFGDKTLPLSQEFFLGGQYSFFGAHENEYFGRQIFLISMMYQYKLPFKIFFDTYFWVRYDLGSTWAVQEEIRFKDLKHGIGASLSFDTPIGPADFSVGKSFIIKKGLKQDSISWGDLLFYFSIGHAITF